MQTLTISNGRSRQGRAMLVAGRAPGHARPQVRFPQCATAPRVLDVFGFRWQGVYYVWTVLCFGWCSSPFIYHGLSDAIAQYIRALGVPILTWLDDFWLSNRRSSQQGTPTEQALAAHESLCLALTIFYRCGYFMSFKKCSLQPNDTFDLSSGSSAIRPAKDSRYQRASWRN